MIERATKTGRYEKGQLGFTLQASSNTIVFDTLATVLRRVNSSVKILVSFTPLGGGAAMFFLKYPGNIFAIVKSRLQGKIKKCTIGGHE